MSFTKPCGPCEGRGYYGINAKATCLVCGGHRLLELPGEPSDYRECSPCDGRGHYGFDPTDTCKTCRGCGLVRHSALRVDRPNEQAPPPPTHSFHPEIERVSGALLRDGHFRNAALDAYIRVIQEVKQRSGRADLDGDDLMNHAFGCDKKTPALRFNDLATESDRNEQRGIMFLFKGIVGLRNAKAHSNTVFEDPLRAYEYLALTSLLMRLLEIAIRT